MSTELTPEIREKYKLFPYIGKTIGLVDISDLPEKLTKPDPGRKTEEIDQVWLKFYECWNRVHLYHGHGNPGSNWRPGRSLLDQFQCFAEERNLPHIDMFSGIFMFLKSYKKMSEEPNIREWTDGEIKRKIQANVIGGRMHLMSDWRVWW